MATGLSAIYDQGAVKYSLGFATTNLPTKPAAIAISLHSSAIGTAKVSASEWTNGGAANTNYTTRASVGIDSTNWTVAAFLAGTGVVANNANQVQMFGGAGLTGTGNNIVAVGLQDSATIGAGNLLWFADITSQAVATGIIVQFNAGTDITLTLN